MKTEKNQEGLRPASSETFAALRRWDAGEPVWTVEMGGMGPGYEQAIQILVWEMVRDNEPVPTAGGQTEFGEAAVRRCGPGYGFSGAQVGAAKSLAMCFLRDGHRATLDGASADRRIQVSREWPRPPPPPSDDPAGGPPAPALLAPAAEEWAAFVEQVIADGCMRYGMRERAEALIEKHNRSKK